MEELVAAGELPLEQLQVVGYALLLIHARCIDIQTRSGRQASHGWTPPRMAKGISKPRPESPRRLKRRCTRTGRCAS
eukprot:5994336-Amphidinium_carterae.1